MNYRIILLSIVFLFSLLVLSAQVDTTRYFVKSGSLCDKEFADSYRKVRLVDADLQRYYFEDYFLDDTLKSRGYYVYSKFRNYNGTFTEFYKNGYKKSKGTYLSDGKDIVGQKVNTWSYWYENGKAKLEELYGFDKATKTFNTFIINAWDTAGIQKVIDGDGDYSFMEDYWCNDSAEKVTLSGSVKSGLKDGTWKGFYADGTLFCEETYNEKGMVEGKSYDRNGTKYTYNKVEVMPEFEGGDAALMWFLKKNISYPLKEQNEDIQGKVIVNLVVDKSGKVKDAKITRSVSPGLDKEALRVVNMLPNFKPGMFRGQPASVYYNLPVVYKLQ